MDTIYSFRVVSTKPGITEPTRTQSNQQLTPKRNKMKTKVVMLCSLLALSLGGAVIGCGGDAPKPALSPTTTHVDASSEAAPATPAMPEAAPK
jgi:hypothetical protein